MSRRYVLLTLVFFGILISYIDRGNLSIAAPAIMNEFRQAPAAMGVLLSSFFWTYAAFQIPAGLLVDKAGIRFVYASAFLLWSLASAGTALSRGPSDVLTLRLLLGLAESVGPLASLAFIRQNFRGPEQGLPVAIYVAGQTLGPACGALLGSKLLADFGWRVLFAVTGLGALLWVPVWLYYAPRHHVKPAQPAEPTSSSSRPLRSIFKSIPFWAMAACILLLSYYWYFVLTWMPSYLVIARGYSTTAMGRIFSVPLFAMAVINILVGRLADKIIAKRQNVFEVRLFCLAAGLIGSGSIILLNVLPGSTLIIPILVISICSFGVASANYWAIAQYASPSHLVGRAIGLLNTLSQIGGVIAPLVTGWTLGPQKDFRLAIVIAGLCTIVSAGLLLLAGPNKLGQLKADLNRI